MAKLQNDVKADEETHKLDGKATKNQKTEKKEFRRKVIDYVLEKLPGLQTRSKRAGLVHNFLRGLGLSQPQGIYVKLLCQSTRIASFVSSKKDSSIMRQHSRAWNRLQRSPLALAKQPLISVSSSLTCARLYFSVHRWRRFDVLFRKGKRMYQ